jgi:hypothetical protein
MTSDAAPSRRRGTTKPRRLLTLAKRVPIEVALMMWRWIAGLHEPIDIGPPTYTWCSYCAVPWPCDSFVSATDMIESLTGGATSDQP